MYVRLRSSFQVVSLPEDFLTLKEVDGNRLTFELSYSYDQELAVKKSITNVSVEVATKSSPTVADGSRSGDLALDVQRQHSTHATLVNDHVRAEVLLDHASDPTKTVSNEVVTLLRRGQSASQITQLKKRAFAPIKAKNAASPVKPIQAQHELGDAGVTTQRLAEGLLLRGRDPSAAYKVNDLGLSLTEATAGTLRRSPTVFIDDVERDLYWYKTLPHLKPITQTSPGDPGVVMGGADTDLLALQRQDVDGRKSTVKDTLTFAFDPAAPDRLVLTLRVKDAGGVTIQTLERVFHPREHIKYHMVPRVAPLAAATLRKGKSYAMLNVRQLDPVATRLRVYKRVIDHNSPNVEPYSLISDLDLTPSNGWKYLPVEVSRGNTLIYHVVPVSSMGTLGSDFATVVLKPQDRNPSFKRVVVTTKPLLKGVLLEVSKLPSDCVSFQLLREDVTVDRGAKALVGSPIKADANDVNHTYTLEDQDVKRDHVYAYHCRVFRKNGSSEDRLTTHYKHTPLVEDVVDTKVSDPTLTLTERGYDVRFKVASVVTNTKIDQVKQLLERQGMLSAFESDVTDVRDQLGKLIAHNVKRIDLSTGLVEDFGTLDKEEFSDLERRGVAGVSELHVGRKYRYAVTTLLRAPETMLDGFVKTSRDAATGRQYSYKPSKFLHPIVAKQGSLTTPSSIATNHPEDQMSFGAVGDFVNVEVTLDKQKPLITSAVREKNGAETDVLRWVLNGTAGDVDHFQIIVERGGSRTIVGKATCVPEADTFAYVRKVPSVEVGLDLRYLVCPVFHDFTCGAEVPVSNARGVAS